MSSTPAPAVRRPISPAWSLIPACCALAWYLLESPPVSGDKDSGEFALALAFNGAAHPSGYPWYILTGHWFTSTLHAAGCTWAQAANFWSAAGGGTAVFFLHAFGISLLPADTPGGRPGRVAAATIPLLLFALNPVWTYETTLAEVYSWHLAWVGAAGLAFVGFMRRLDVEGEPVRGLRSWGFGWGLLAGLGAAHHLTSVLLAGPLTVALLVQARRRGRSLGSDVLTILGGSLLPLLGYAFIAWRAFHPASWQWPTLAPTWESALRHVTGSGFGSYLGHYLPSSVQVELLAEYVYPYIVPALLLLAAGTVLTRTPGTRTIFIGLACAAFTSLAFAFSYGAPDPSSYFLAPLAIGLVALVPALMAAGRGARWRARSGIAVTAAMAVTLAAVATSWIRTTEYRKELFIDYEARVAAMWRSVPFTEAFVLWPDDMHTRLIGYQLFDGQKPGIEVVNPFLLLHDFPRRTFVGRHGFDPVAGIRPPGTMSVATRDAESDRFAEEVAERLNRMTTLPVILFDPGRNAVHLLRK